MRYWDYSEKERSELTQQQVDALLAVELMEKGVVRLDPPTLLPVEEVEVRKETYYVVGTDAYNKCDYVFRKIEDAQAFISSQPLKLENDWRSELRYVKPAVGLAITAGEYPSEGAYLDAKAHLHLVAENKKANDKASEDYQKQLRTCQEAGAGVWEDWHECRQKAEMYRQIEKTRQEYRTMCNGDWPLAESFLRKAYKEADIDACNLWFNPELANADAEPAQSLDVPF